MKALFENDCILWTVEGAMRWMRVGDTLCIDYELASIFILWK